MKKDKDISGSQPGSGITLSAAPSIRVTKDNLLLFCKFTGTVGTAAVDHDYFDSGAQCIQPGKAPAYSEFLI